MKAIAAVLLTLFALPAVAQVTCKENVMTANRFCSSKPVRAGSNYYMFATDDPGITAKVLFNFGGLVSASRPDGVMVKLDSGAPFKVAASHLRPDVNCSRYGGCIWSVSAVASPSDGEFAQMGAASKMLVSFTEGAYVSDPIEVDPKQIAAWFNEWKALNGQAPVPTTGLTAPVPASAAQLGTQVAPVTNCDSCQKMGKGF